MRQQVRSASEVPPPLFSTAQSHSDLLIMPNAAPLRPRSFIAWSFGQGSVIWSIWPAVLLHVAFAAVVVSLSLQTKFKLVLPPVLLTVLGLIIGFVISYRAITGYDRYWMGRTCWTEIIRNSRTMGRLIWFHVPPYLTPDRMGDSNEMTRVMKEKRMVLNLIEGFAVALKHHLRGEAGIHYEDLYHLVEPLHSVHSHAFHSQSSSNGTLSVSRGLAKTPSSPPFLQSPPESFRGSPERQRRMRHTKSTPSIRVCQSQIAFDSSSPAIAAAVHSDTDAILPPTTTTSVYGTFHPAASQSTASLSAQSLLTPRATQGSWKAESTGRKRRYFSLPKAGAVLSKISGDLVPFMSFFHWSSWFSKRDNATLPIAEEESGVARKWASADDDPKGERGRPRIAGGGKNLPLDILSVISDWVSVLEARGTVPGAQLGSISACIENFEKTLSSLEMILTTPLPFAYSTHIRHTVWIFLFFLPFQLVGEFGWATIPCVGVAAFIYLGFLAAGEEIEQPFGYDTNDLDLDLFTGEIIHGDLGELKVTPCLNAYHAYPPEKAVRSVSEMVGEIENRRMSWRAGNGSGFGGWDPNAIGIQS